MAIRGWHCKSFSPGTHETYLNASLFGEFPSVAQRIMPVLVHRLAWYVLLALCISGTLPAGGGCDFEVRSF